MRVQFQVSGGVGYFPGLAAPRTIDGDALSAGDREALSDLIAKARFFDLPAHLAGPRGAADNEMFQITIEDEGRRHTVAAGAPIADPALQALVDRLRELAFRPKT
ncbi:MAG: protealysin inhibitor emfourin [Acidobacteriota bacterium]